MWTRPRRAGHGPARLPPELPLSRQGAGSGSGSGRLGFSVPLHGSAVKPHTPHPDLFGFTSLPCKGQLQNNRCTHVPVAAWAVGAKGSASTTALTWNAPVRPAHERAHHRLSCPLEESPPYTETRGSSPTSRTSGVRVLGRLLSREPNPAGPGHPHSIAEEGHDQKAESFVTSEFRLR